MSRQGQHHLRITGQLDGAWRFGSVGDCDPAQLNVVVGRYADLRMRVDPIVAAAELGTGLGENGLVTFSRLEGRLPSRGPEGAAVQVAQIAEGAPAIARGVFTPARYGQVAPAAVTAPRAPDRHMVSAIGKQIDL